MAKNRTKQVGNWSELIEFIESINPHKKTLVLNGWLSEPIGDKIYIRRLIFSTRAVSILKEGKATKNVEKKC